MDLCTKETIIGYCPYIMDWSMIHNHKSHTIVWSHSITSTFNVALCRLFPAIGLAWGFRANWPLVNCCPISLFELFRSFAWDQTSGLVSLVKNLTTLHKVFGWWRWRYDRVGLLSCVHVHCVLCLCLCVCWPSVNCQLDLLNEAPKWMCPHHNVPWRHVRLSSSSSSSSCSCELSRPVVVLVSVIENKIQ